MSSASMERASRRQYQAFHVAKRGLTDGIVHGLVYGRAHPPVVLAGHDDLGDLKGREVTQAQLDKLALLVQLVDSLERLGEWHAPVSCVQVEDVDAVSLQLGQTLLHALGDACGLVNTSLVRVAFGGQRQAAIFPVGRSGEAFLLATNVRACGVDFIVAL